MVISWLMTLLFLGAVTAVFFFVLSLKSQILLSIASEQHNREKEIETIILVYAALITVILFNKLIMGAVFHKLCHFEHHSTTTALEFHFALKYSVGMFFTTALMTLAVEDIRFHNFYAH